MERVNSDLEWDLPRDVIVSVLEALSPVFMARCACIDRTWREAAKQLLEALPEEAKQLLEALSEEVVKVARGNPNQSLSDAAFEGRLDDVKIALLAGAEINFKNPDKIDRTPLMVASWQGNVDVVRHLIEQGADVNIQGRFGFTAIFYVTFPGTMAFHNQRLEILRLLVDAGADVNVPFAERNITPLMMAAGRGLLEVVRFLIGAGANQNLKRHDNKTAKDIALERMNDTSGNLRENHREEYERIVAVLD